MAVIGHWVAADAAGAGTTLPDRSASAADGTLTAGCSWSTVAGEAAVRCPGADYVAVPNHARWTLGDFTFVLRLAFHSVAGVPGLLAHSDGSGPMAKWVWTYGYSGSGLGGDKHSLLANGPSDAPALGNSWTPTLGTVYGIAVKRSGDVYTFYRDGATDGTDTKTPAMANAAAPLQLGWGGESFFNSDVSLVALRIYDEALTDAAVFAAMAEDATGPLAVTIPLAIPLSAALTVSAGPLSADVPVQILVGATLASAPLLLGATLTLSIPVTATELAAPTALLDARLGLAIGLSGALQTDGGATAALRASRMQRPFGRVESSPGVSLPGVLRFDVDTSLDTPADGWSAELAGAALMLAPDDAALYRLPMGLLDATGAEVLAAHLASGRILERRLVGHVDERRTYVRGVDALERTFKLQRAIRYVPNPPTEPIDHTDTSVTVKVGTWKASTIAADLAVGSGLTVSWEVRDYTFVQTFDGIGTLYDLWRRLVEPWSQVPPLGVDITAVGTVVHIRPRLLHPPSDVTLTVAESGLVEIELGPRRRLPLIGPVVLEGRPFGWNFLPSDPPLPESSTLVVPYAIPVHDLGGNLISQVDGERTYRMPDNLLLKHVQRESQTGPSGTMMQVKEETTETTYEPTSYGPSGPLTQPLPLTATKSVKTLIDVQPPAGSPAGTASYKTLAETVREEIAWSYDTHRMLAATTTRRYRRTVTGTPPVVSFPEVERIEESRTEKVPGWLEVATTRTTFDPTTGKTTGSVTLQGQDAAGLAPGGVRPPVSMLASGGAPAPGRITAVISTDPTAIPVHYSNVNLTRDDLDYILAQWRTVSGLVEYPLRASGPALPDLMKGLVLHLTEYRDEAGTAIPLDPAQLRRVAFAYVDTRETREYTVNLDGVFYRAA